jgi:hypothetical protein
MIRSLRSRSSRTSTKSDIVTAETAYCKIGWATRFVRSLAVANPAAIAAKPSASGKPIGRSARQNGGYDADEHQCQSNPPGRLASRGEVTDVVVFGHDAALPTRRQLGVMITQP